MKPITLQKYQIRAQNFYMNHCGGEDPNSAQICAALLARCQAYRPNAFSTLKSALAHDQTARGNSQAAKAIRALVNPVTAPGSALIKKPKPRSVRSVSEADLKELLSHLHARELFDEASSVVLAYYLGVRPCEMRTITAEDNHVNIIGGKKSAPLHRGADRTLTIDTPYVLNSVKIAAQWMSECERSNTAIRDRLRKECRALWPRRTKHPTLKSFRHQMGSNLKASGESDETVAYIMGHQSTESVSVYGNRRSGANGRIYVKAVGTADLSKVRKPKQTVAFDKGKVIGRIEIPARLMRIASEQPPGSSKSQ